MPERRAPQDHASELMRQSQRDRHDEQQQRDAERGLDDEQNHQRQSRAEERPISAQRGEMNREEGDKAVSVQAMKELDGGGVFCGVSP